MEKKRKIQHLYKKLLKECGPRGWWPVARKSKGKWKEFYHPLDYSLPSNSRERFEICIGAILAQNTSWRNAQRAVLNLYEGGLMDPKAILSSKAENLCNAIRCSRYYNNKARKLREFSQFYLSLKGRTPSRKELLGVWGVGPETADSILLYAYHTPSFVVDAYARRLLASEKLMKKDSPYDEIKEFFESSLPRKAGIFNEFHALIVEWGISRSSKTTKRSSFRPVGLNKTSSPLPHHRSIS